MRRIYWSIMGVFLVAVELTGLNIFSLYLVIPELARSLDRAPY